MGMFEERVDAKVDEMLGIGERRRKDRESYKIADEVFDKTTRESLAYLSKRGKLERLLGVISTGKEANVFCGLDGDGRRVAVKIYRTYTTDFRRMWEYLAADPRVGYVPKDMRKTVLVWTRREFKNLQRAIKYAVRVPEPIMFRNNVLLMEFIGDDSPAPRLKDAEAGLERQDFEELYGFMMGVIERLWRRGEMVHGDLSEYNVLLHDVPVVIDWSQATVRRNRMSAELLRRDIRNVSAYFRRRGIDVEDPDKKFSELIGL